MKIIMRVFCLFVLCAVAGCAGSRTMERALAIIEIQQQKQAAPGLVAPAPAPVAAPIKTATHCYPGESVPHKVTAILEGGHRIKLEDDSLWEIAPDDRDQAGGWRVAQRVTVYGGVSELFPCKLTNFDNGHIVAAKLVTTATTPPKSAKAK